MNSPALLDPAFYAYMGHYAAAMLVLWGWLTRHRRIERWAMVAWAVTLVAFTLIVLPRIA